MFAENNKRRWQCFVCGMEFYEYDPFAQHIIEKHEKGREYVLCPLARCNAPVRDINLHFRTKHPNEPMPRYDGPNRAIVWKDYQNNKKKKKKGPQFRKGHFVSTKNGGREFEYMSSYECAILECLEEIPEVLAFDAQPFKGKTGIPYIYRGEQHHYFPDFSVQFADGRIEIWEIKPANQTALELNEAKWAAANIYCQSRGWDFIVLTEVGISKLKKQVKKKQARS